MRKLLRAALLMVAFTIVASPAWATDSGSISLLDGRVQPALLIVRQWQVVTWTNLGKEQHGVSSDSDATLASGALDPGSAFATVFQHPGTFRYRDPLQPGVVGTVVVLPALPSGKQPPPLGRVTRIRAEATAVVRSPREVESGIGVGRVGVGAVVLVALGGASFAAWSLRRRRGSV